MIRGLLRYLWNKVLDTAFGPAEDFEYKSVTTPIVTRPTFNGEVTDRDDPRLGHGFDTEPTPQQEAYLVLSKEQRADTIRPLRYSYKHLTCGTITTMSRGIAQTYAANPYFYGYTYCVHCELHRPVGEEGEFVWDDDGTKVGT